MEIGQALELMTVLKCIAEYAIDIGADMKTAVC